MAENIADYKLSGWKKKTDQKKFNDGYKLTMYTRKQEKQSSDLIRVDSELENVTIEELINLFFNPSAEGGDLVDIKTLEEYSDC